MHDLHLLLIKLCLPLPELSLFGDQVATLVLSVIELLPEFILSLIHLLAEVLTADFYLLELDLELFRLLDGLLLLLRHHVLHSFFVSDRALNFNFEINCSVANFTILMTRIDFFLVDISENLLLLLLVLVFGLLLALGELCLLRLDLALALIKL